MEDTTLLCGQMKSLNYNKIHTSNKINLKGFMIGNPYMNYAAGSKGQVESYWGHQRIPISLWNKFKKNKCTSTRKWKKKHLYKCQRTNL